MKGRLIFYLATSLLYCDVRDLQAGHSQGSGESLISLVAMKICVENI